VLIISDAEEDPMTMDEYEELTTPTPTPVSIPALIVAPVPTSAPAPTSSSASLLMPMPPLVAPVVHDEMGWTCRNYFKQSPDDAPYHTMLTNMLDEYYVYLAATDKYYCAEHTHP